MKNSILKILGNILIKSTGFDVQIKQIQKNINKYGQYIEDIEKDIAILKKSKGKLNKLKERFK
tara:strand:- start:718 stop:906 length:189 start_codon:yes stop_codon:yes gene_type:complete